MKIFYCSTTLSSTNIINKVGVSLCVISMLEINIDKLDFALIISICSFDYLQVRKFLTAVLLCAVHGYLFFFKSVWFQCWQTKVISHLLLEFLDSISGMFEIFLWYLINYVWACLILTVGRNSHKNNFMLIISSLPSISRTSENFLL